MQRQSLITRRLATARALVCAATLAAAPVATLAQAWPTKPIRIVVPFSPGTAADIVARQLAPGLGETLGQTVVVENITGTGGGLGAAAVAKAAPDGYTLVMFGVNHAINPSLYKDLPYDTLRDLKPIVRIAVAPLAIVAHPSLAAGSIGELVALAKAQPGKIFYGSGGNGSVTHLALELLKAKAGIDIVHVPYKGVAQLMTDVIGNQLPLAAPAAATALPQVRAAKLKVLAITSARRSSAFPEVPTVAESGFPDYDVSAWNGLLAPAGTPDEVIHRLHAAVAKVAGSPAFVEQLHKQAMDVDLLGPADFRRLLVAELAKWGKLVKDSGAKLD